MWHRPLKVEASLLGPRPPPGVLFWPWRWEFFGNWETMADYGRLCQTPESLNFKQAGSDDLKLRAGELTKGLQTLTGCTVMKNPFSGLEVTTLTINMALEVESRNRNWSRASWAYNHIVHSIYKIITTNRQVYIVKTCFKYTFCWISTTLW